MVSPAGVRGRSAIATTFRLSEDTYLEPDVVIYPRVSGFAASRRRRRCSSWRSPNSSLSYDLGRKAALYASFGVRELWVIDAVRLTTQVFREPAADTYRDTRDLPRQTASSRRLRRRRSRCGWTSWS